MKLADFFAAIAPFLEGRASHAEAAKLLFPETPEADAARSDAHSPARDTQQDRTRDAQQDGAAGDRERLAIYGRFCRNHRFEALDSTFSETRAAVVREAGEPAWDSLVTDYFRAHPMRHAELNENGSELPAFLAREVSPRNLASWIAELADYEWWSFRTRVAPDDPLDKVPEEGPLRIGATVELRPYQHDLVTWIQAVEDWRDENPPPADRARETGLPESLAAAPESRVCVILFWRDRGLDVGQSEAFPLELAILQALFEKRPLDSARERAGAGADELKETVADLHAAGILRGLLA